MALERRPTEARGTILAGESIGGYIALPPKGDDPTLTELGLTKRSYALRAEIRMGELLRETDRAVGTDKGGKQYVDSNLPLPSNSPPTLAELGLTKREQGGNYRAILCLAVT